MLTVYDSYDSSNRNCEDDTEYTTEWCTSDHDDEYEEWREVERLAHHVWNEEVILYTLDDEIECYYTKCHLPSDTESDDECWDESNEWSNIWDELHDTTDECECELLLYLELCYPESLTDESYIHHELYDMESHIGRGKYTHREYECCFDPWGCDVLDRLIVFFEVFFYSCWCYLHDELAYILAFEYHEECRDSY